MQAAAELALGLTWDSVFSTYDGIVPTMNGNTGSESAMTRGQRPISMLREDGVDQTSVRVDDCHADVLDDIPLDHVPKEGRLSDTGLAEDGDVASLVFWGKVERLTAVVDCADGEGAHELHYTIDLAPLVRTSHM